MMRIDAILPGDGGSLLEPIDRGGPPLSVKDSEKVKFIPLLENDATSFILHRVVIPQVMNTHVCKDTV